MIEGLYNRWLEDRSQPDSLGTEENLIFRFMYVSDYQDPALNPPPEELLVWHLRLLPNIWSWTIFKKRVFFSENQGNSPFQVKNRNNLKNPQGFSLVVDPLCQSSWRRNAEIQNRLKGVSSPFVPSSPSSQKSVKIWRRLFIEFSNFVYGSTNCTRKKKKVEIPLF